MRLYAFSNGYRTGQNYVVFEIPHDNINQFTIYRNNVKLVSNDPTVGFAPFVQPTKFDTDHHTNLFKKDSTYKLMYIDTDVQKYQWYDYFVVAERIDESGTTMERIESNRVSVETQ